MEGVVQIWSIMPQVTIAPFAFLRLPAIAIWAVGVIGYLWCAVDIAVRHFLGPATLLPLFACGLLLLTLPLTLIRPGRKYGMTLALYVVAAAIVGVSVIEDLRAGVPLPALTGLGGVVICCWVSAAMLIFDRQRQRMARRGLEQSTPAATATATEASPTHLVRVVAGAAALVAASLIAGTAFLLPSGADHRSVSVSVIKPVPASVSSVGWTGSSGAFLDYPHLVQAAGAGYIRVQTSSVQAFDGQTGLARWHFDIDGALGFQALASSDGSAVVVSIRPGAGAAVAGRATKLLVLDANTGDIRWSTWRLGSERDLLLAVTATEIWVSAGHNTSTAVERLSLIDGELLITAGTIEIPIGCQEFSRSVSPLSEQILVSVNCSDGPKLMSFDVVSGDLRWSTDIASEQAEILRTAGVAQFTDLAAIDHASGAITVVVPFAPGTTQILSPSKVIDADGTELFTIAVTERPIQVLDSAVISWRHGTLVVHPLAGDPYDLTNPICTPDENSGLLSLNDEILASCSDNNAIGVWGLSGPSTPIAVNLGQDADMWLWAIPGSVLIYDSTTGTMQGLQ